MIDANKSVIICSCRGVYKHLMNGIFECQCGAVAVIQTKRTKRNRERSINEVGY